MENKMKPITYQYLSLFLVILCLLFTPIRCLASLNQGTVAKNQSFFDQRYRGWLWFEEQERKPKQNGQNLKQKQDTITPTQARAENQKFREELQDLREVMIARPTTENVIKYLQMEEVMWNKALALDVSHRDAKFLDKKLFNKLLDPENVHAVKLKRKLENAATESIIKEFARNYDLIFFSKKGCPYCTEFAPVLKNFSTIYGFKTEEAGSSGELTNYFPGKILPHLAKNLNIDAFPAVVVIKKDGTKALELIRGYVTLSELEEYIVLADKYLKQKFGNEIKRSNNSTN